MNKVLGLVIAFCMFSFAGHAQIFSINKDGKKDKKDSKKSSKTEEKSDENSSLTNPNIDAAAIRFLDSLGVEMSGGDKSDSSKKGFTLSTFNPFNSKERIEEGEYTFPEPITVDEITAAEYRAYLIRKSKDIRQDKPGIPIKAAADRYQLQAIRNAKGNELMYQGFYDHAYFVFDQMLSVNPNLKGVQFNAGYCVLNGYGDPARALPYLKSAVLNTTYKPTVPYFEYAPTEAIYWLGVAYHRLGDLEEAERKYKLFLSVTKKGGIGYDDAVLSLEQLNSAKQYLVNPGNGKVINAESINTPYAEIAPRTYNFNGNLLFASARISPNEINDTTWFNSKLARADFDIYTAERNVYLEWENPKKSRISGPYDDYPVFVDENGSKVAYFNGKDANSDIFQAKGQNNAWKEPVRVFTNQQSQAWSPFASISPDGKMAIFSMRAEDGYGGLDLYFTRKDDYGQWSDPVNLGENINSPYDETTPSFHPNGKAFFFSSNRPESMGGYDIFKSTINEMGIFSSPTNMKPPVNSFFDDLYFSFSADGTYGFLSRNGGKQHKGDFDIYEVNFKAINFSLNQSEDRYRGLEDAKSNSVGNTYVRVNNLLTKTAERISKSERTGKYYIILQPCTGYRLEFVENNKVTKQETFSTSCNLGLDDRKLELSQTDFGNIELTLKQRSLRKDLESEYSRSGRKLKWQVFVDNVPYGKPNMEVNLLDRNGNIIKSFSTDPYGRFDFNLIPESTDYIFEVQVEDNSICHRLKVVLKREDVMLQDYTYPVHQCFK
ncbi:PD40 domain-containing protein [Luteibaculum oceani]|uniref:Uncharacterized protein n=1 Tax=Luteibaculum oceani TaxID=1294296 RepID=A0A5C6V9C0_9FLAO|nr:PD40 domain-containing protein [Luteibaculum oceani]TXC82062.1 hypothetical protein FRX97_02925 [Luteibaculum oceani]